MLHVFQASLFLFLLLAPCALAILVSRSPERSTHRIEPPSSNNPPPLPETSLAISRPRWPEVPVTGKFAIRSFPKGLLHRRTLALRQQYPALPAKAIRDMALASFVPAAPAFALPAPASPRRRLLPEPVVLAAHADEARTRSSAQVNAAIDRLIEAESNTRPYSRADEEAEAALELKRLRTAEARAAAMEAFVQASNASALGENPGSSNHSEAA